ncbi:DUF4381 domain-containing protein [Vibrio gallicus]|uniref:DUF4381 domain-containing protein n=1 Tax=Vibrio gallicus TaxID=190897 RepID=UPI0021C43C8F|nr:DUF4381 domain-containing protein [Vibrio gallicus]
MSQINSAHSLPLKPLHLPLEPSSWPLAWGYWSLLAVIVIALLLGFALQRKLRRRRRAKKAALHILKQNVNQITVSQAQELLRQAALSYFPRKDIAQLTGANWLTFLDSQLATPRFLANQSQWQSALYCRGVNNHDINTSLIEDCQHWLEHALPPKRKYRDWNAS